MLADGIEAATRTLSEPSFDRIQGLVQKMINKVFASGELNECDLTLRDLHVIAKCFTRVLSGIYHQRIAYSEPAEKVGYERSDDGTTGDGERKEKKRENLKRLGVE
jgi:membrane-associated HD superfamily phosphohydrolase